MKLEKVQLISITKIQKEMSLKLNKLMYQIKNYVMPQMLMVQSLLELINQVLVWVLFKVRKEKNSDLIRLHWKMEKSIT